MVSIKFYWFINMQTDMQQPESIHARQDAQRAITLIKVGLLKYGNAEN